MYELIKIYFVGPIWFLAVLYVIFYGFLYSVCKNANINRRYRDVANIYDNKFNYNSINTRNFQHDIKRGIYKNKKVIRLREYYIHKKHHLRIPRIAFIFFLVIITPWFFVWIEIQFPELNTG